MKIIKDEDLPVNCRFAMKDAVDIFNKYKQMIMEEISNKMNNDERFGNLNYSQAISYVLKIFSLLLLDGINFANFVGNHFPDSENNIQELFHETIDGLYVLSGFKKIDKEQYNSDIKKIGNR